MAVEEKSSVFTQSSGEKPNIPLIPEGYRVEKKVLILAQDYAETLKKVNPSNELNQDDEAGYYKLSSYGRENAHNIFVSFIARANGDHQLLRSALEMAYKTAKNEFQQKQDERLSEQGWALLRTVQSIQGVNTWQEANKIYAKAMGQTATESAISGAELYKVAKNIKTQLESQGILVSQYLEQDKRGMAEILNNISRELDRGTSVLLGRVGENLHKLKHRVSGWLPIRKKDSSPQIATGDDQSKGQISRRSFLKFAGATFGASVLAPVVRISFDPEFQAGVGAAAARPELPNSNEGCEVAQSVLHDVYKKHFHEKEHLMPEVVWARTEKTQHGEKLRGTGVHLALLAQNCFKAERKDGEGFNEYYVRFVDSLHELSDSANLDFITLIVSLQISAENVVGYEEPKEKSNLDVNVSRIQEMGITAARAIGLEANLVKTMEPEGNAIKIRNKLENIGVVTPLDAALPKEGIRHYDLIRFREQPTTGIMDMEPGERSGAVRFHSENQLTIILMREYPKVFEVYKIANEKYDAVTKIRENMRIAANNFIERHADVLQQFSDGNTEALNAIGISPQMDPFQLQNYTDAWYKLSEIPTNPEFAYQRTVEYIKQEAMRDPQAFYRRLFSQQIRNPKFLKYLEDHFVGNGDQAGKLEISNIKDGVAEYEERARDLRVAHLNILREEGPLEYDSRFQQISSILVTKQLSDIAGEFDPTDRDSLGWHIYKVCAAREIAPISFLVDNEVFARDITIDPPYAKTAVIDSLDTFSSMLKDGKIINNGPDADIYAAYHAIEKMFWRDGGVWPSVPKEKWEQILDFFNAKLVNRLFYDYANLLRDKQKMSELSQLMISRGIISQPANEDPYYFFTQFTYLMLDSWHMRRDVSRKDWDEVERYFKESIVPIAISKIEVEPGVFKEKWNIGSADYPPIFRAQAVMYNFLFDKNPNFPRSTSSIEILGHH